MKRRLCPNLSHVISVFSKALILILLSIVSSHTAIAETRCFVLAENGHIISKDGDCESRRPCCSTFKIAISLMGFNEGILLSETEPELPFMAGYYDLLDSWKQPQTPLMWMKNSCVWYSQVLTQKIGVQKFSEYVSGFDYGNCDVSGDKGKDNGLTNCWLSSSLQISGIEQTRFLARLLAQNLPVRPKAIDMTKKLLYLEDLEGGWKLYGKTGSGHLQHPDGSRDLERPLGWFVGWINKDSRHVVFAHYLESGANQAPFPGIIARKEATERLLDFIRNQ